ncbi:RNA 2',3'-cyclic phosphodiesterase [Actinoplanes sp. LDG1-06]|uniref:RNA 2',3'-cyclic phosphodiesterase n=1 Tax=Paractinoplanes ovalisporus TaxID=2810368 RepID=A0ABS2AE16_9ACTN|nr:RNA 2',3'-cyclic phosphodiesterase [Actinoplanes ovalisporus]MBM2618067.1 RNA 2',3'-cyclic phosphodiesterase [Actinoplanes ovalisporus]
MGRRPVRRRPRGPRVVLTRLFVAVYPPPSALTPLLDALPSSSRLTALDKWHLTLVFLGDAAASPVAEALADVPSPPPFELRLSGGGRFGSVSWAGVDGDVAQLHELREGIRDALTLAGFPSDSRPFQPHLTVSYTPDPALRNALAAYEGAPWPVTGFTLLESTEGRYNRLASWLL